MDPPSPNYNNNQPGPHRAIGGGLFLFRVCRDFVRGDVERGGQRVVRADGTRPIKSQRFLFHQKRRIEASDQLARKEQRSMLDAK